VVLSSSGEEGEDILESPPAIRENITFQASEKPRTLTHPPIAKIGLNRKKTITVLSSYQSMSLGFRV
jgi:hypothetical protein